MNRVTRFCSGWLQRWHLSLYEKVILVNSIMLIGEALAGLWVTSHNLETHHYLIDTGFIVLATLLTLLINIILLHASFRPLFSLLTTIREISAGKTSARAAHTSSAAEISELAQAFNSMLDRLEAAQQEQTMLILQAQEEERRRIALELHDEAGQNLTALLIHTEILQQNLHTLPSSVAMGDEHTQLMTEGLQQLSQLTQLTLENVRILAQQLRPSVLDDLGLLAAFRWLVEDSHQSLHLIVDLTIEGIDENSAHTLPQVYKTTLFRIAQESLTNIARHAQVQHVAMTLAQDQHQICLQVRDRGRGFNTTGCHTGSGIIGMRERAALLKGTLTLQTEPGKGTTVQAVLPLPIQVRHIEQNKENDHVRQYYR